MVLKLNPVLALENTIVVEGDLVVVDLERRRLVVNIRVGGDDKSLGVLDLLWVTPDLEVLLLRLSFSSSSANGKDFHASSSSSILIVGALSAASVAGKLGCSPSPPEPSGPFPSSATLARTSTLGLISFDLIHLCNDLVEERALVDDHVRCRRRRALLARPRHGVCRTVDQQECKLA